MQPISFVDLRKQYLSIEREVSEAIAGVFTRADFIQGVDVALFEKEFASSCGAREAVGVSSGTSALHLALLACGVQSGDEVITTPFTFIATAEAISHVDAIPVFADICPATYNISPESIEASITDLTKAIVVVHLYGRSADMDSICEIARRYDLKLIEDAAQAHGATYRGRKIGTFGNAACFSFYPGKNLGAYGDAGAVVTDDAKLAEAVRKLRDHGRKDKYEHQQVGYGARLDTIQAAVLRVKLKHLGRWNAARRALAALYRDLLRDCDIQLPPEDDDSQSANHLFVVRTQNRDRVRAALGEMGIATGVHYPIPVHLQPAYWWLGYSEGDMPESERAAREVLSLPLFPELSHHEAVLVAKGLERALDGASNKSKSGSEPLNKRSGAYGH